MKVKKKSKSELPLILFAALLVGIINRYGPSKTFDLDVNIESFGNFDESDESIQNYDDFTTTVRYLFNSKKSEVNKKEFYAKYSSYIESISSKISEISNTRDIVKDFAIYETMLKYGVISYDYFLYSTPPLEIRDLRGANVAIGEGVCINEAFNMADVFKSLGYKAKVILGKSYHEGEDVPDYNNHAVVYVSDGDFSYLLDPTNDAIYLRKSSDMYFVVDIEEYAFLYFLPDVLENSERYGFYLSLELLSDNLNKHDDHWKVLKNYSDYKEEYLAYLNEFYEFEQEELLSYEEYFKEAYGVFYDSLKRDDKFMQNEVKNDDIKRLTY